MAPLPQPAMMPANLKVRRDWEELTWCFLEAACLRKHSHA